MTHHSLYPRPTAVPRWMNNMDGCSKKLVNKKLRICHQSLGFAVSHTSWMWVWCLIGRCFGGCLVMTSETQNSVSVALGEWFTNLIENQSLRSLVDGISLSNRDFFLGSIQSHPKKKRNGIGGKIPFFGQTFITGWFIGILILAYLKSPY